MTVKEVKSQTVNAYVRSYLFIVCEVEQWKRY